MNIKKPLAARKQFFHKFISKLHRTDILPVRVTEIE